MKRKTFIAVLTIAAVAALVTIAAVTKNSADDRKTAALVGQWTAAERTTVTSYGEEGLAVYRLTFTEDGTFTEQCTNYMWREPVPGETITLAPDTRWSPENAFPDVTAGDYYRYSGNTLKLQVTDYEKEEPSAHTESREASLDGDRLYLDGRCYYQGDLSVRELCERCEIPTD